MQVQTVNKHAERKYAEFQFAISSVENALGAVELMLKKCSDPHEKMKPSAIANTRVSKEELEGFKRQAIDALAELKTAARKYKIELTSKGWRV
jgi:hypothetical protein